MSTVIVVTADLQGDAADLIKAFRDSEKASRDWADDADQQSRRANGAFDSIKKGAGLMAGALATYFSAQAIGDFVEGTITAAADLQQSAGAVDAVFKEQSTTVKQWAADSAEAVGLSSNAYNQFASLLGTQMKTAGFDIEEAAYRTKDLIGISADLASMFGGTTSDAVSSLSAAFRGEFDSVEKYGLALKEGDIQARLAAKGLGDLTGEQARNARAVELMAMIYEQTADAQGNFARESDTLQGQQQRLAAEFENQQAALGQELLPAMTAVVAVARDVLPAAFDTLSNSIQFVEDAVANVQTWFEDNEATIKALALVIAAAATAYGIYFAVVNAGAAAMAVIQAATKAWTAVQWLLNAAMSANPLGLIITLIGALVGAIIWVATQTTFFQDVWAAVSQFLIDTWTNVSSFFTTLWETVVNVFTTAWNAIVSFLTPIFEFIASLIRTYIEIWVNVFLVFAAILKTIWDGIVTVVTWAWEGILSFVTPIVEAIASFITGVFGAVADWWNGIWQGISDFFSMVWLGMQIVLGPIIEWIASYITNYITTISGIWNSIWGGISGFFTSIWETMKSTVSAAVSWIGDTIGGIYDTVMGVFASVGSWLYSVGQDLIKGFWNGISGMWNWITEQIGGFFTGIVDWAKDVLGIASPSKVMMEVGYDTGSGVAVGLERTERMILRAAEVLIPPIPDPKSITAEWTGSTGTYGTPPWAGAPASPGTGADLPPITIEVHVDGRSFSEDEIDQLVEMLLLKIQFALGGVVAVP